MRIETCFAVNLPPRLDVKPSLFNVLAISLRNYEFPLIPP